MHSGLKQLHPYDGILVPATKFNGRFYLLVNNFWYMVFMTLYD